MTQSPSRRAAAELTSIGEYGLIGDTRTAALVSPAGSIDWMCVPHFDGDPLFGRLVGGPQGGAFRLGPADTGRPPVSRCYHHDTATLETRWDIDGGRLVLTEAMPVEIAGGLLPTTTVVRRLTAQGGPVKAVLRYDPRLGERHREPRAERRGEILVCRWGSLAVSLQTAPSLTVEPGKRVEVLVSPDRPLTAVMAVAHREPLIYLPAEQAWELVLDDETRWRRWAAEVDTDLPYGDAVMRSLLTLRLLTYSPSGAPVAAPTTSLPEQPGGERNWDYRFAWPRDASIGVGAFLGVGKTDEARSFMAWLLHASRLDRPRLPVLLSLHGRHAPSERVLDDWPGYAASTPVRGGNGAAGQHQLDGYGWVLDAAWLLTRAGRRLYPETWRAMRGFADHVSGRWRDPDAGIWEIRGDAAHHVHSKLMAWLALDRALRIADTEGATERQRRRWAANRNAIGSQVNALGFNPRRGSYTRTYGSADLDSALLILPLLDFEPANSPKTRRTVEAIRRELGAGGPLLYRYPPGEDGLPGSEGAFLPCSFWLVQALARIGEQQQAHRLFGQLLDLAGPLGLYAEEIDPTSRQYLGNYPQALTHAGMIQAALALRSAQTNPSEDGTGDLLSSTPTGPATSPTARRSFGCSSRPVPTHPTATGGATPLSQTPLH